MNKTTILIADDHEIVLEGLRLLFEQEEDMELIGEARDGREAIRQVNALRPDAIILDITMPGLNGVDAARRIHEIAPDCKIIILSMHLEKGFVTQTFRAGASGYLLKNSAFRELAAAVREVMAGGVFLSSEIAGSADDYLKAAGPQPEDGQLSSREREVLQLFAENKTMKEIADLLNISLKTVEAHRRNIRFKLGVDSTVELIKYAIREGLTTPDF
ncbi:MAG: response regulator [bacterium]|nr:response regulator [bacterium]